MWTTPEKHTKRRETLGNANQNKNTRRAGYKKVCGKNTPKKKYSELKEAYEMLNKTKTLTTIARQKKAKEKALKMKQSSWKGALQKPLWEQQSLQNAKKNKKTAKNSDRRLARSSKKQQSENTDKWHLCKAGSFSYGESPRTAPLEGTSLHRWNNSVERPWGDLEPVYHLFTFVCEITLPQAVTCGLPPESTLRGEKH